jgi:hypothetical protein
MARKHLLARTWVSLPPTSWLQLGSFPPSSSGLEADFGGRGVRNRAGGNRQGICAWSTANEGEKKHSQIVSTYLGRRISHRGGELRPIEDRTAPPAGMARRALLRRGVLARQRYRPRDLTTPLIFHPLAGILQKVSPTCICVQRDTDEQPERGKQLVSAPSGGNYMPS